MKTLLIACLCKFLNISHNSLINIPKFYKKGFLSFVQLIKKMKYLNVKLNKNGR